MDSDIIQDSEPQIGQGWTALDAHRRSNDASPITGAYLCSDIEISFDEYGSVTGKINSQIATLCNAGLNCSLETYSKPSSFLKKVIRWLPFTPTFEQWPDARKIASNDYLYIRKPPFNQSFINYLSTLKSLNPNIKIIMELPTYPYEQEFDTPRKKLILAKDRHHRKKLKLYLDRIADLSGHDTIFDIPTIQIINGVDFDTIHARQPSVSSKEIHILSVSGCQPWHGLDRIIQGLHDYYSRNENPRTVYLHLVGDGPELQYMKALSKELQLEPWITFYGEMKQANLGELYDSCSLAFENLGWHRTGVTRSSSLKSREYLAKGIPFVFSCNLDVFQNDPVDFCLAIPADETPVDFKEVVKFHENLYRNEEESQLIKRIRSYGEDRVSMNEAMKNVLSYINEECDSRGL